MNDLTGKTAIVTGASKGIGAAIAKALAAAGAAVAVNYASDKEGAERVVAEITGKGGKALAIRADMSKAAEVKQLFEATKKALGAPKVLVNNAGVFDFKPVQDVTEADFHRHVDINVLARCWRYRRRSSISRRRAAASSISARSRARIRCRPRASIPPARPRSTS